MKIIIIIFLLSIPVFPQISPGDLTNAHAKLEGISNCTKCHVLGKQVENFKCLDCHTEISGMINSGRGFHSSGAVKGQKCSSCHNEHHGKNFRIVVFNKDKFDHSKTLFNLTGKHSKINCIDCHQSKYIRTSSLKNRKNTYLGMDLNCNSCHEDVHQGTLGSDCTGCHNTEIFKPAVKFNHDNSTYKLIGAHIKVDCNKCHIKENRNGKTFQKFKGVIFASCMDCHKDIHQGKFGKDCKSCHVTSSFKNITRSGFNHSKTNYPLLGKHQLVKCEGCHKNNLASKPPYKKCIDCHTDYHKGEFTVKQEQTDCSKCHTVDGFQPSLYSNEEHQKSAFQLTGAHLAVSCQICHYNSTSKDWHFHKIGLHCIDCHKNVHGTELKEKYMKDNDCTVCHKTDTWQAITFDHGKTNFQLLGKHASVSCGRCHHSSELTNSEYRFATTKTDCLSCHKDIHFGQFSNTSCEKCHGFNDWKAEKFDHNKTNFTLEGAHANIKCIGCHKKTELNGTVFIKYKLENFKCATCHSS